MPPFIRRRVETRPAGQKKKNRSARERRGREGRKNVSARPVSFAVICKKEKNKVLYGGKKRDGGERECWWREGWGGGVGMCVCVGGVLLLSRRLSWHMFCIRLIQIPWRRDKSVTLSIWFFLFYFGGMEGWGWGWGSHWSSSPADKRRMEGKER